MDVYGDKRHAEKSLDILTAYADTLQYIPETNDAPLLAGLEGMKIVYAAEILKYTYKEADASSLAKISKMILKVFLPVLENFYAREPYTNGNWGLWLLKLTWLLPFGRIMHQCMRRQKTFT